MDWALEAQYVKRIYLNREADYCMQINKEAGLLYSTEHGDRFSSSLQEQPLQGRHLQAVNFQGENVAVDMFCTHVSTCTQTSGEGFTISLSITG